MTGCHEQKRNCNDEKRHGALTRCSSLFNHLGTHIAEGRDFHLRAVQPTVCFSTRDSGRQFRKTELLDKWVLQPLLAYKHDTIYFLVQFNERSTALLSKRRKKKA